MDRNNAQWEQYPAAAQDFDAPSLTWNSYMAADAVTRGDSP